MTNIVGTIFLVVVTGYCPCKKCCGRWADGITASRAPAVEGTTVAANWLPFGTVVRVQGFRVSKVVQDRMSKKFPHRLDIFFRRHADAAKFGKRNLRVEILRWPKTKIVGAAPNAGNGRS